MKLTKRNNNLISVQLNSNLILKPRHHNKNSKRNKKILNSSRCNLNNCSNCKILNNNPMKKKDKTCLREKNNKKNSKVLFSSRIMKINKKLKIKILYQFLLKVNSNKVIYLMRNPFKF